MQVNSVQILPCVISVQYVYVTKAVKETGAGKGWGGAIDKAVISFYWN